MESQNTLLKAYMQDMLRRLVSYRPSIFLFGSLTYSPLSFGGRLSTTTAGSPYTSPLGIGTSSTFSSEPMALFMLNRTGQTSWSPDGFAVAQVTRILSARFVAFHLWKGVRSRECGGTFLTPTFNLQYSLGHRHVPSLTTRQAQRSGTSAMALRERWA